MKLVIELPPEKYAVLEERDGVVDISGAVTSIEVRQQEGLLSLERPVLSFERLGAGVAHERGLTDSPAIRVWLRGKEDSHAVED